MKSDKLTRTRSGDAHKCAFCYRVAWYASNPGMYSDEGVWFACKEHLKYVSYMTVSPISTWNKRR